MTVRILTGTKQEIADSLIRLEGEVREVIAFVDSGTGDASLHVPEAVEDMFAEMDAYTVSADDVDDSREAIYSRLDNE